MRKKTREEYIEAIYSLERREGRAQTGKVARIMKVKPSSATEMLQKLKREGLLMYENYTGATLTPQGAKMAIELGRKHSAIAEFLGIIGVSREVADSDACQIEHHVSRETLERMEAFVEFLKGSEMMESFNRYCRMAL